VEPIPPEALLADYPPPIRDIGEWLRGVVRRATPGAIERVRPGWRLIGYDIPNGRRTTYFAMIWAEPIHVHLGFQQGVLMADPDRRLEGRGITKQVRWLTLVPGRSRPTESVLAGLVREAARVATLTRGERLAIAMTREEESR